MFDYEISRGILAAILVVHWALAQTETRLHGVGVGAAPFCQFLME